VYAGGMVVLCQLAVSREKREVCVRAETDDSMLGTDDNVGCATDDDGSKES
jgi:hypothetical protein